MRRGGMICDMIRSRIHIILLIKRRWEGILNIPFEGINHFWQNRWISWWYPSEKIVIHRKHTTWGAEASWNMFQKLWISCTIQNWIRGVWNFQRIWLPKRYELYSEHQAVSINEMRGAKITPWSSQKESRSRRLSLLTFGMEGSHDLLIIWWEKGATHTRHTWPQVKMHRINIWGSDSLIFTEASVDEEIWYCCEWSSKMIVRVIQPIDPNFHYVKKRIRNVDLNKLG